jgi:hypothetical protein
VVIGDVPGAPGAGGGVNGVQDVEANLRAWMACSIGSSRRRKRRLEMVRRWGGSADGVYVVSLQYSAGEEYQRGRQREGRGLGGEREHGVHRGCRIGVEMPAGMRSSGERFCRPGGAISRESRGEARGGRELFIGATRF